MILLSWFAGVIPALLLTTCVVAASLLAAATLLSVISVLMHLPAWCIRRVA